uniref:Uncharacterized protein AlNc14C24G2448 n=1 Tax=Albugo laibachii Nc14 TaxID=890382 RepID=F0W6E9_9STRA|nr:hypothetical protein ALNC14_028360 [Albugo laibachii Nc14]|eukprot:CCA16693.1 hypothetical protein ALNC14_028360 [Albugo laibachii Nc14]
MAVDHMERNNWLLDSGATSHMCYQKSDFQSLRDLEALIKISIADGSSVEAVATGNISITLTNGERVTIHDVLYVPDLDRRLLPIPALVSRGLMITFGKHWCDIISGTKRIIRVQRSRNMYMLEGLVGTSQSIASVASLRVSKQNLSLWHARLGHLHINQIQQLQQCVSGIYVNELLGHDVYGDEDVCAGCAKGKAPVNPFNKIKNKEYSTADVLEIVHSDIMGPMTPTYSTISSNTSLIWNAKRQTTKQLKCIRTDNGTEYVDKRFDAECRRSGIVHQCTAPLSPQLKGLVEQMNRTLMERARPMLTHKNVEKEWWAEAVNQPRTLPIGPDLGHLRVLGSTGFAHIDKSKRSKLDAKAYPCLFLGYADESKAYRVFNKVTNRAEVSCSLQLGEGSETRYVQVIDHSPTVLYSPVFIDDAEGENLLHGTLPESQNMENVQVGATHQHPTTLVIPQRSDATQLYPPPEGSSPMYLDEGTCHGIVPLAPTQSSHMDTVLKQVLCRGGASDRMSVWRISALVLFRDVRQSSLMIMGEIQSAYGSYRNMRMQQSNAPLRMTKQ